MLDQLPQEETTKIILDVFKNVFTEFVATSSKWVKSKGRSLDLLGKVAKKYEDNMEEQYNVIRIMGMKESVPLRKIYVKVNMLDKITYSRRISIDYLESEFDFDRRGFGTKHSTWDGSRIISDASFQITKESLIKLKKDGLHRKILKCLTEIQYHIFREEKEFIEYIQKNIGKKDCERYISKILRQREQIPIKYIVLGKPGAGKSTFLKYLALQALDGKTQRKRIPIFISLKDLSDSGSKLFNFILEQFEECQLPDAEPFVTRLLENGRCLILLDGLDEVSKENGDKIIKDIISFSKKRSNNQFIVSCRIAAYNHYFDRFLDVELADFDNSQKKTFINNWFQGEPKTAKLCWQAINKNIQINDLSSTPLLLTLLCIAFDETLGFPQNRAELYKEAIDALLKKWDASKRITREEVYKQLSLKRKEDMFSIIAAKTFSKGKYFLSKSYLTQQIQEFIQNLLRSNNETYKPDSECILEAIECQHGIFVQRAKGIYSFSHLTFQEYFTAKYIVDNSSGGTLEKLVNNYFDNQKWREVILLTTALIHNLDNLLIMMANWIQNFINKKELKPFISKLDKLANKHKGYPAVLNRSLILTYIFFHSETAGFSLKNMDTGLERAINMTKEIAKSLKLDDMSSENIIDASSEIAEKTKLAHVISTDQNFGLVRLISNKRNKPTYQENSFFENISVYLMTNTLIMESINGDCYLSIPIKDKILEVLLSNHELINSQKATVHF